MASKLAITEKRPTRITSKSTNEKMKNVIVNKERKEVEEEEVIVNKKN